MLILSTKNIDYSGYRPLPKNLQIRDYKLLGVDLVRNPVNIMTQRTLQVYKRYVNAVHGMSEY